MSEPRGKNPYVGPRTFTAEEGELFFGRERDARDLLSVVITERLVLFYAQSGAGKSSLINTRLIPGLIAEGDYRILPVGRLLGEALKPENVENIYVYNLISSLIRKNVDNSQLARLTLSEFLAGLDYQEPDGYFYNAHPAVDTSTDEEPIKYVLMVDQFEELFTAYPEEWRKREDFLCQLAQAMDDFPNLQFVLTLREDYIAQLEPYAHLVPGKFRSRYYMERLGQRGALEAIQGPARRLGRPFVPEVAQKLVNDLSTVQVRQPDDTLEPQPGQYVEPVQLQVVCYSLWEQLPGDCKQITQEHLNQYVGDVDKALGNYFAMRVEAVAQEMKMRGRDVSEHDIRDWFGNKLITSDGVRNMVAQEKGGRSGGLDDLVVQEFVRKGDLVRAEKHGGATFYELTHDRLVEPILQNNEEWFKTKADVLQNRTSVWLGQERNASLLLRGRDLRTARKLASKRTLTREEKTFLDTSTRTERTRNLFIVVTVLALVFLISLTLYAWNQTKIAIAAKDEAYKQGVAARSAATEAIKQKSMADNNAATARANEEDAKKQRSLAEENQLKSEVQGYITRAQIFQNAPGGLFKSTLLAMDAILRSKMLPSTSAQSADAEEILRENLTFLPQRVDVEEIHQDGAIDHIAFSNDGKTLVTASANGSSSQICGWSLPQRKKLFCQNVSPIQDLLFTLNGALRESGTVGPVMGQLMASDSSGHVMTLDPASGEIQNTVPVTTAGNLVDISPDGRKILIINPQGKITVNDVTKPKLHGYYLDSRFSPTAIVFSPSGQRLVGGAKGGTLAFWGLNDGSFGSRKDHNGMVNVVRFTPDERYIITGGKDHYALILDRMTGGLRRLPHTGSVSYLEVSPDGTWIATGTDDRQIRIWELKTGKEKFRILQDSPITGLIISPRGQMVITAGEDKYIHAWNAETGREVLQIPAVTSRPVLAFNNQDDYLYVGDQKGEVSIWDISTLATPARSLELVGMAQNIQYLPQDKIALTDGSWVWILPPDAFKGLTALPNNQPTFKTMSTLSAISHMAVSRRLTYLAVTTDGNVLETVNLENKQSMLFKMDNTVKDMAFSSDGQNLITLDTEGKLRTWLTFSKASSFKEITPRDQTISSMSVGPKLLAMGSADKIWLADQANPGESSFLAAPGDHTLLAFSADGSLLADANSDGTINIWHLTNGSLGLPIRFQKQQALSLAFSPDGTRLAIGTARNVFLVDTANGSEIARIPVSDIVNDISFSEDGSLLTVASANLIQTWELGSMKPNNDLVQAACARVGRNLNESQWKDVLTQAEYDSIMAACGS